MQYKYNQGFLMVSLLIAVSLAGVLYFVKDANGKSYLNVLKDTAIQYMDKNNLNPIEEAKEVKNLMDKNQRDIEAELEAN